MKNKHMSFDIFVIVLVILTGAGFGALIGFAYYFMSDILVGAGLLFGIIGGYVAARIYLHLLPVICAKGYKKSTVWVLNSLVATGCGVLCTTLIHGVMLIMRSKITGDTVATPLHLEGFRLFIMICETIGAAAGFVVGGVCSWVYLSKVIDVSDEVIEKETGLIDAAGQ
ncbi:MAG: hypothetical protein FVQ79_11120 [Planctomycetes bacterium]|nr:hypothetical protein [Planctomycetota bacterium]